MRGIIQRRPDRGDAAIHHIGRGDDITAGMGLMNGLLAQDRDGLVIGDLAITQHAVMTMIGKGVERDVANDAKIRTGLPYSSHRPADKVVAITGERSVGIFQRHVNRWKDGDCRDAKIDSLAGLCDQPVDAKTHHTGHRVHSFGHAVTLDHEHWPDQIGNAKARLRHQTAGERLHPVPTHARGRVLTSAHLDSTLTGVNGNWRDTAFLTEAAAHQTFTQSAPEI